MWIVGPSRIQGNGIFCTTTVPAGSNLGVSHWWDGHRWNTTEQLGKYHNHSNTPTCRNVTHGSFRYLIALRDLQRGDEATTDYRLQPDLEQPAPGWR